MKRLECLDGLRGALAVYVMLGHMAPFAALPAWIIGPLSHGGAAVDVFFILSGLVIFRSLESCRFEARPFLILRITRIFPVFLVMFAAGTALQPLPEPFEAMPWVEPGSLARDIWSQNWPTTWAPEIAAHLTMTHGLFPNGVLPNVWVSFSGAAWSLSTEWQFYVLALVLGRSRMSAERLAAVFLALAAVGLLWDVTAPEAWRFSRAFLPNKAQYFALGIASAAWVDRRSARPFAIVLGATLVLCGMHGDLGKLASPLVWTLCLAAQRSPRGLYQRPFPTNDGNPGVPVMAGPVPAIHVLTCQWLTKTWIAGPSPPRTSQTFRALLLRMVAAPLRWRISQWFGAISYPIYLANEPIQKALAFVLVGFAPKDPVVFTAAWLPAAVLVPIGVAALVHRYVEIPSLQWGRALVRGDASHGETKVIVRS